MKTSALQVGEQLRELHMKNLACKYCKSISPTLKEQLEMKVVAENIFKDKKKSYPASIKDPFINTRLGRCNIEQHFPNSSKHS